MTITVTQSYLNGHVVEENRAGARRYYALGTPGSTAILLDGSGTVTDTYTYWP